MKKNIRIFFLFVLSAVLAASCTDTTGADKTYSVAFRVSASTNVSTTGVTIDYALSNGIELKGTFVSCSNMPWQSTTFTDLPAGTGVGFNVTVNNAATGFLTMQIMVDGVEWKMKYLNLTSGAKAILGGTL
jgi:hypothetical protein